MVYFCDYTKPALKQMEKYGITNADIQEVFNNGFTESQYSKFLDKDGFRTGIHYSYDGYTLRYVIISVYRRPLKIKNRYN